MPCGCTTYDCVDVLLNTCNIGTAIGIEADETGNWTAELEFNGVVRQFGIAVTDGEEIAILTTLLNEKYTHELKLFNIAGELVNDTCYWLKTKPAYYVADAPVPPPLNDTWQWGEVDAGGSVVQTVQSDLWKGDISPIIWMNSNPINWVGAGITQDAGTGTLDFSAVGGISGIINFQYKNLL